MARGSLDDVMVTSPGASRRDQRRQQSRRRKRRRGWVAVLLTLTLIGGAAYGAYVGLRPMLESVLESFAGPQDYQGAGGEEVTVVIPQGATGTDIGRILEEKDVVLDSRKFVEVASADPRSTGIQPGTYALRLQMSSAAALDILASPANRIVRQVTLREGLRAASMADVLAEKAGFDADELKGALKDPAAIGLPKAAKGEPEGFLFPSTYEFEPDTTAVEALSTMADGTKAVLKELGVPAAKQRDVIIKASIVQAESGSEEDFGKVARVIENRLRRPMRLQMDSTVAYGAGHANVFTTDAERQDSSNPYNTYAHDGLPRGPISNPGRAAIEAVLDPTPGDWLYFVTVNLDTGETKFAATDEEHQRNRAELQQWMRENE